MKPSLREGSGSRNEDAAPGPPSPGRLAPPRLVMLDLDGTLVDSVPDLSYCVDRTLEALGLPVAGKDKAKRWVGSGIEGLLRRLRAPRDPGEDHERIASRPVGAIEWMQGTRIRDEQSGQQRELVPIVDRRAFRPPIAQILNGSALESFRAVRLTPPTERPSRARADSRKTRDPSRRRASGRSRGATRGLRWSS